MSPGDRRCTGSKYGPESACLGCRTEAGAFKDCRVNALPRNALTTLLTTPLHLKKIETTTIKTIIVSPRSRSPEIILENR